MSEGWADFVGHTFSFIKYGNNVTQTEWNEWTVPDTPVTGNYQQLLEQVPTYFNDFIPRGLFYDLTDVAVQEEQPWDNIQGFTINHIYQKLNPNMTTIQQFRTKWDTDHPNTNNAALFNQYGVQ